MDRVEEEPHVTLVTVDALGIKEEKPSVQEKEE